RSTSADEVVRIATLSGRTHGMERLRAGGKAALAKQESQDRRARRQRRSRGQAARRARQSKFGENAMTKNQRVAGRFPERRYFDAAARGGGGRGGGRGGGCGGWRGGARPRGART